MALECRWGTCGLAEASKAAVCSCQGVGSKSLPDSAGCRVVAVAMHPLSHQFVHSTLVGAVAGLPDRSCPMVSEFDLPPCTHLHLRAQVLMVVLGTFVLAS